MISLADSKRILGRAAQNLSDDEILSIRDSLRDLAEIFLEIKVESARSSLDNYSLAALQKQEKEC